MLARFHKEGLCFAAPQCRICYGSLVNERVIIFDEGNKTQSTSVCPLIK